MTPPFVIFGLPRSRTFWLAVWLSEVVQIPVMHDLAIDTDTIDDWLELVFRHARGTCETGAVEVWPILRRAIPECRIAVIQRPLDEVVKSLSRAGFKPNMDDLHRRAAALSDLAEQPGVLAVQFDDLCNPRACAALQEHCLGVPFAWPVWAEMDGQNLQCDAAARMARLIERRPQIMALRAELIERLANHVPFVTVGEERWSSVADTCQALGAVHHVEASAGLEGPFRLNRAALAEMERIGVWRIFIARVDGEIAGYCCWTHETNLEADAVPTMAHGPFYVAPQFKRHRLGARLLAESRRVFEVCGYKVLKLHHTMHGRGARAGRLYESMGAVEFQREYIWKLGAA